MLRRRRSTQSNVRLLCVTQRIVRESLDAHKNKCSGKSKFASNGALRCELFAIARSTAFSTLCLFAEAGIENCLQAANSAQVAWHDRREACAVSTLLHRRQKTNQVRFNFRRACAGRSNSLRRYFWLLHEAHFCWSANWGFQSRVLSNCCARVPRPGIVNFIARQVSTADWAKNCALLE